MKRLLFFLVIFAMASLAILFFTSKYYGNLNIKCRGEFDSYIGDNKLMANVGVSLQGGKGIVIVTGNIHNHENTIGHIKATTVFSYVTYGKLMYVKVQKRHSSISGVEINADLQHLLPMVFSSRDIEHVYEVKLQNGGSYLIKQHGLPILYCKNYSS